MFFFSNNTSFRWCNAKECSNIGKRERRGRRQCSAIVGCVFPAKQTHPKTELPLTVDPLLASGNPSVPVARRHMGDSLDHRLTVGWNNFVSTTDSRCLITCGYPDYSFRVIDTDSAKVRQVIYGHGDVVTCIARSETSLFADCYVVTGSNDCTVALWHWNGQVLFSVFSFCKQFKY
ncbi:WD domain, G-beta repeat protein [Oesophagostomum dentatum]|uniref:WD domain, G-beta repeat protein n=1 Tax=Oesophagostomum dentatum TaxID=61180 RepID=A0A0B1RZ73_OESDE|nr:WD domain, G-beta repeat protein [Oesophagostomum dentatum]